MRTGRCRQVPPADLDLMVEHRQELLARMRPALDEVAQAAPSGLVESTEWSGFGVEAAHRRHERRVFVAKFNPGIWGEPAEAGLWRSLKPDCWLWDSHGTFGDRPANSCPALRRIGIGDLVVVMRLRPTDEDRRPVPDPLGFDTAILVGVWVPVLVHRFVDPKSPLRPLAGGGRARIATEVWHVPLVRFTDPVVVKAARSLDPGKLDTDPEFSEANWTLVEAVDGGDCTAAARLLAACSLPAELLTCPEPLAFRNWFHGRRTGMQDEVAKYWRDMRYRHRLRTVAETTAVERSREQVLRRGFDFPECWDRQHHPGFGADYECHRRGLQGVEKLAVEVKGTRYDPWLGKVHLRRSQFERACRHADGHTFPAEAGYDWELHIQPGVPVLEERINPAVLPDLEVLDAEVVRDSWRADCVDG